MEKELSDICSSILQLLDDHLIPTASSGESKVREASGTAAHDMLHELWHHSEQCSLFTGAATSCSLTCCLPWRRLDALCICMQMRCCDMI